MKKSILSLIIIFAVIAAASNLVYSQQKQRHENMHQKMMEKLNLTDNQKAKIADLMTEHQKAMIDLRADLQKKRIDLKELIRKGNFSRSDFLNMQKQLTEVRDKIAEARANHMMDVYGLLTDQQKKIFSEMPMMRGEMRDGCKMMEGKRQMKRMQSM